VNELTSGKYEKKKKEKEGKYRPDVVTNSTSSDHTGKWFESFFSALGGAKYSQYLKVSSPEPS
jgi:hypothetical protein